MAEASKLRMILRDSGMETTTWEVDCSNQQLMMTEVMNNLMKAGSTSKIVHKESQILSEEK
jgi:hypothetical protein